MLKDIQLESDNESHALLVLLDGTTRDILRAREIELNQYGLTHVQARVLFLLQNTESGATITDITKMLSRKPHSTSQLLRRMNQNGFVKKVKTPRKRTVKVFITPKGQQSYSRSHMRSLEMIFSVLSDEQRQQLNLSLNEIRNKARVLLGLDYKPPFLE